MLSCINTPPLAIPQDSPSHTTPEDYRRLNIVTLSSLTACVSPLSPVVTRGDAMKALQRVLSAYAIHNKVGL